MAWLTIDYNSEVLHMPVAVDVLIPQGHGGYQTLYLLHGAGGDHASWLLKSRIADYVEGKNIAVVMPSGNNRCYVNNQFGKNYEDYISGELIDKMEKWFTLDTHKQNRYIAGMSMGGYGAVYHALRHPNLYSAAYSYSGLLDIVERYDHPQGLNLYPIFGEKENFYTQSYDLETLIHNKRVQFTENVDKPTEFYLFCGLQDVRLSMTEKIYHCMQTCNMPVYFESGEGGHDWDYWDRCIKKTIDLICNQDDLISGRSKE